MGGPDDHHGKGHQGWHGGKGWKDDGHHHHEQYYEGPPAPHFDSSIMYYIASTTHHDGSRLSVHAHYDKDKRNDHSDFCCVHLPGWKGCTWAIQSVGGSNFHVVMGKDTEYKNCVGRRLAAHNTLDKDKIDSGRCRAIIHDDTGYPGDTWAIRQMSDGTYTLTVVGGNCDGWVLSSDYPNNARGGGKSHYVCVVRPGSGAETRWKIEAILG